MKQDEHKIKILKKIEELSPLVEKLCGENDLNQKVFHLLSWPSVSKKLQESKRKEASKISLNLFVVYLSLLAIGEEDKIKEVSLLTPLCKVETFYEKIGGLVGYHVKALTILASQNEPEGSLCYETPHFFSLSSKKYVIEGIKSLPYLGEIHLVGGLGDRLKLMNDQGEALPAALLPFLGKSLLEVLIRDLVAREYLYYKIFKKRIKIPLALMTSLEEENERYIKSLLKKNNWYGRGSQNFSLFSQILVPVIDSEGQFVFKSNGDCLLHPGGHGAIWKAAEEEGIYEWFKALSKKAFLIRQINNPIAGLDGGLIAFAGCGIENKKTIGIASCERVAHAAEGILLNIKKENLWTTLNIEYTDFQKYSIQDVPDEKGFSAFSTNTNILFVNLEKIEDLVKKNPLPECLLNMKSKIDGKLVGRLECMMQNITHFLKSSKKEDLQTFVTFNARSKTISTTKKAFEREKSLLETPEGAFFDLLKENKSLLEKCSFILPPMSTTQEYIEEGPSFVFLYHPALGPFYDIIAQKIKGGKLSDHSELNLEISELFLENLSLQGSLFIEAKSICDKNPGFCFLKNIRVENKGIKRSKKNIYWKNEIEREEWCHIILEDNAEFIAENVVFKGNMVIHVPSHMRFIAYEHEGEILFEKEEVKHPLSWNYSLEKDAIRLVMGPNNPAVFQYACALNK